MDRKRAFSRVLDILFPPKCVFCRRLLRGGERDLCPRCRDSLPWTGDRCAQEPEFLTRCVSPLWYRDAVKESFHRYKFGGTRGYAGAYGRLMAQCVRQSLGKRWDVITWVPLSAQRLAERGYDQAMLLAMSTALELEDVAVETLRKAQDVQAQSGLQDAAQRRANVLGIYEAIDPELIRDKRVLLVDDVVTTGATLSECARTLLQAGAEEVMAVTLARARK